METEKKMLQSPSSKMSDRMWGATTIILGLALVLILGVIGYLMGLQHDLPNARIDGLIGIAGAIIGWFTGRFQAPVSRSE